MDIIGIDIGTVSIKYIRIQRKAKKLNVVSKNCFDFKGTEEDLEDIIGRISSEEGSNHEIAIGLTSQEIFKKTFTMPIMPKEEIKEAIIWSASKVISVPIEDTYYEFDIVGDVDERGVKKRDIFFAGLEKEYAQKIIGLFERKGFKKITLLTDISFLFAPYIKNFTTELSVVIDIGGRITGIYIVENGKSIFFREILTASESFTDALMGGFGYSYAEAEAYKKEKGFTEESDPILSTTIDRFIGEIQRTFNVFLQKYPDRTIRKIYLTGRGSKIPNLLEKLRHSLTEEVSYIPLVEDIDEMFLPSYLLCVKKSQVFNFLPPEIKFREKVEAHKRWIRIATVSILSILGIITINMLSTLKRLDSAIEINKILISKKKEELTEFSKTIPQVTSEDFISVSHEIKRKDLTYLSLLKYLSSKLPRDISLKEVNFESYEKEETTKAQEEAKQKQQIQSAQQKKEVKSQGETDYYIIRIKGYVFGEKNMLETALLELIIKLEETGFMYRVEITGKEIKTVKGREVMEFELKGRCAVHEV